MGEMLHTAALPGYEPEIGRWLWALEEVRSRTLRRATGVDQAMLDWQGPDGTENSIGSQLHHIALVELSWLYFDLLLEDEFPPPIKADFPHEMGTEGRLTHVPHVPIERHLDVLSRSRMTFLEAFRGMSLDDWNRLRARREEDDQVSPAWVLFHLVEHEAGHTAQISGLKTRAIRFLEKARG